MSFTSTRTTVLVVGVLMVSVASGRTQAKVAVWLDAPQPASWNAPGGPIPDAPKAPNSVDPRCRDQARPPQVAEDARVQDHGWQLIDAYQGGWHVLVIPATASYDGMCRPLQYQHFVFVDGVFAGTLSPQPMDSRTDGALSRVWLQNDKQLIAEYLRYDASDPLCCPSRTTRVEFDLTKDHPMVRPVSASTTQNSGTPPASQKQNSPLEGTYWKATELAGKPTPAQDPTSEAHLKFQAGRVSGSDGCNLITGSFQLTGERVTFGQLAGTQMACVNAGAQTEGPFRNAVNTATRLTISGDRLDLFDAAGTRLASFVAGHEPALPPLAASGLAGTSWRLVKFQSMDDTTLKPDDRSKYTITFEGGGKLTARIDCNRGVGTWKEGGPSQITFGPMALTRAMCAPGSMHDQIVRNWEHITSYVLRDGHLFLAVKMDSGIYEFEPVPPK